MAFEKLDDDRVIVGRCQYCDDPIREDEEHVVAALRFNEGPLTTCFACSYILEGGRDNG